MVTRQIYDRHFSTRMWDPVTSNLIHTTGRMPSKIVPYNSRTVVVQRVINGSTLPDSHTSSTVLEVFGYLTNEGFEDERGRREIETDSIPESERAGLSALLSDKFSFDNLRYMV